MRDHVSPQQPGGWRTLAELPGSTPFFLVNLQGNLYAGTGNGQYPDLLTKLWQYDAETNSWKSKKDFPGKLADGLSYFTVAGKLYVGFSTTGETDPFASFGLEVYSSNFYEYDPATDNWKTVAAPPRYGRGAISFPLQPYGVALWGTYRNMSSQQTKFNAGGVVYDAVKGWMPVNVTISNLPAIPQITDDRIQSQVMASRVIRYRGFGFSINNRVYTGGGDTRHSSTVDPFYGYEEVRKDVLARELYEFEIAEKPGSLDLAVSNAIKAPAPDYDLTLASQAFALDQTGYIITAHGQLVSFRPASNQWQKFNDLTSPLVVGTGAAGKAYFINQTHQLLEYTPD
ncbi:hypothetical protein ACFQ4C_20210 [Larkinella insperata]|uniref:Galactose oxidase n=1 Tax=Larkinella insperata TaxID=332158 RepID=A0ABW3QKD1_9BACT|nr:hypothetical protein [Larkinella insperata]